MKANIRRLRRLEERFEPALRPEDLRLFQRLVEGRRRVEERRKSQGLPPLEPLQSHPEDATLTPTERIIKILHRGRDQVVAARKAEIEASRGVASSMAREAGTDGPA